MLTKVWDRLKGWKTFLVAAIVFLASAADYLGAVDIHSLIGLVVTDKDKVDGITALLGLVFGLLRLVTYSPPFKDGAEE